MKFISKILNWLWEQRWPILLFVAICESVFIFKVWGYIDNFINPSTYDNLGNFIRYERKYLNTVIPLLLGAPYAFFIWVWRDFNKKEDIKNARQTLVQSDFHKIQTWATDKNEIVVDSSTNTSKDKENKNELINNALQVTAIYQLKEYLIGNFGEQYKRPTLELYRSLLELWITSKENIETKTEIRKIFEDSSAPTQENYGYYEPDEVEILEWEITQRKDKINNASIYAIFTVIKETIEIKKKITDIDKLRLDYSDFRGAKFENANLKTANLNYVDLRNSNLKGADFQNSNLKYANLEGAKIDDKSNFEGADLSHVNWTDGNRLKGNFIGLETLPPTLTKEIIQQMRDKWKERD
jgi:hypothetical protein